MSIEKGSPVVIDNGSGVCKAGFSGEDAPRTAFPAVVGYPKYLPGMMGVNDKQVFIG
jgi:actin